MMRSTACFMFLALTLTSCSQIDRQVSQTKDSAGSKKDTVTVHLVLDKIKQELRIFKREFETAPKPGPYTWKCKLSEGNKAKVKEFEPPYKINKVEVSLTVTDKASDTNSVSVSALPIAELGLSGSRFVESTAKNTVALKFEVDEIPPAEMKLPLEENGLADAMLQILRDFGKVDSEQPCFMSMTATLQLVFMVQHDQKSNGGFRLLVLNLGKSMLKSTTYMNTVTVELSVPGGIN
ncbi:hypothetical protein [Kordiimonas sp.]|uniref:hypothetical protein n=1 Tax=Kordiimonas sp. TaxID=1970157 RepID=UPI003A8E9941